MRIRSLTSTFVLLVASTLVVVAAAFTWVVVRQATDSQEQRQLSERLRRTMELNQRLRSHIDAQMSLIYAYLDTRDPALIDRYEALHFDISQQQVDYLRMDIGDRERLRVARIRELQEELARRGSLAMDALRRGDGDASMRQIARMEETQSRVNDAFEELSGLQANQLHVALSRAERAVELAYAVLLGIVLLLGGLSAAVVYLLRRRVQQPLDDLLGAARRIREGDLTARASEEPLDEIGRAAREFNFMADSLQESHAGLERKVEERAREIRELQEQLVESERMSAVGQLVSGVAHELNNPLTAILGLAELESDGDGGDDAPDQDSALQEIVHQAERCRRIVDDLLQFVRQRETKLERVSLNEVVERTLRLRDYEADTHGIRLVREYDPAEPLVEADPYKLEQVILILVNNAIDAIREAEQAGTVTVSTAVDGDRTSLAVVDTGPGVAEPGRVFEPFYTTKEVGKGTGLGLSVAYGIVSDHDGEIRADNWADGARFTVLLPRVEAAEAPADEADAEARPAETTDAGGRLLVVDDEQALLTLQERIAERMGLEVATARTGELAIELLARERFDAVVCDLRMPGRLDGRGVLDWIRENRPELADRFVFVSGDMVQLEDEAGDLPAPTIAKPFNFPHYRDVILGILREGRS